VPSPGGIAGVAPTVVPEQVAHGCCTPSILTTFDVDGYVYAALKAGATGYLLKDVAPRDLVAAVRAAAVGEALLAPAVTRRLIERYVALPPPGQTAQVLAELTDRERDLLRVLRLVARGLSNAEIAEQLWVSAATVKTHVARLPAPGQARPPRPGAGGRRGVRDGARPTGRTVELSPGRTAVRQGSRWTSSNSVCCGPGEKAALPRAPS
jgi:hypothetical protein